MTATRTRGLEPYDQGYRDGWHDIHVSPLRRRKRRRQRSAEYALGYQHGRTDGATWGQYPEWAEFTSAPRITEAPELLVWTRRDGAFHAATWPVSSSGAAEGTRVASAATRRSATGADVVDGADPRRDAPGSTQTRRDPASPQASSAPWQPESQQTSQLSSERIVTDSMAESSTASPDAATSAKAAAAASSQAARSTPSQTRTASRSNPGGRVGGGVGDGPHSSSEHPLSRSGTTRMRTRIDVDATATPTTAAA